MFDDEEMPAEEMPVEEEMPLEEEESPELSFNDRAGAFQSAVDGTMPGMAELMDLVGESGPSFHDSMAASNPPPMTRDSLGGGATADFTGQAPYDPELVKQDIRALLNQRAQERSAASAEFQARATEALAKGMQGF